VLVLAQTNKAGGHFARALEYGRHAVRLFQSAQNIPGECMALTVVVAMALNLGLAEEAVKAGLMAVRLSDFQSVPRLGVLAQTYLGIAQSWSHEPAEAEIAFKGALAMAGGSEPPLSPLQPTAHLDMAEAVRLFHQRYRDGLPPEPARLANLAGSCAALVQPDTPLTKGNCACCRSTT
jgi:hypothetical protein